MWRSVAVWQSGKTSWRWRAWHHLHITFLHALFFRMHTHLRRNRSIAAAGASFFISFCAGVNCGSLHHIAARRLCLYVGQTSETQARGGGG